MKMAEIKHSCLCSNCYGSGTITVPSDGRLINIPCVTCNETGQVGIREIKKDELPRFFGN